LIAGESLAFSPDGRLLAAAGWTPEAAKCGVSLWEFATRKRLPQFGEDARFGYTLAFSPDGKTLGVTGFDGVLRLWEVATGKFLRELGGLPLGVTRGGWRYPLAFSPDGKMVAGPAYYTNVLCLWDRETGQQRALAGHDSPVEDVVASPDGKIIASRGQFDAVVQLWEASTGKHLHTLRGHRSRVTTLAFAPDGRTLVSGGTATDDLHLWEVATGKELHQIKADIDQSFASLAVSPDGKTLAAGTSLGAIYLWEIATGKPLLGFQAHPPTIDSEGNVEDYLPVNTLLFSPDGKTLVSRSYSLTFWVWSVATGQRLRVFQEPGDRIGGASLALSPDGRTLTALGRGDKSFVWELASGRKRREFPTPPIHPGSPGLSAFSTDARTFALCGYPNDTVYVWDLVHGQELGKLKGHVGRVTGLRFLPGNRVVSASDDTTMLIWEGIAPKKNEGAQAVELSARQLAGLWSDLEKEDAGKAYQAMRTIMTSPQQAIALIQDQLTPVPPARPVAPERLAKLIADLDSDHFAVREQASTELAHLGPLAEGALKKVLVNSPSLEVRVRVERLLDRRTMLVFTPRELRMWRALEVLEHIGSPARPALQRVAGGAPGHFFTEEAKAALKRLAP
jgi:WD40 repeat protein